MSVRNIQIIDSTSQLRSAFIDGVDIGVVRGTGALVYRDPNSGAVAVAAGGEINLLAADGAIPIVTGVYRITKGSAAALTLAAPTAAQEGTRLTIFAGSAFAHVITATNLLEDGVTGGAKDTATFAAFVGACIVLVAINLTWYVESKNVVTIAAV